MDAPLMLKILKVLIPVFLLNACSTMPSGPSVLILPGAGDDYALYHKGDLLCRQLAHTQMATSQGKSKSKEERQQDYDLVYIQCMYGKVNRVPVPAELIHETQEEWHPPPPPNMPALPQPASPKPSQ
jgi:hypothetical protein